MNIGNALRVATVMGSVLAAAASSDSKRHESKDRNAPPAPAPAPAQKSAPTAAPVAASVAPRPLDVTSGDLDNDYATNEVRADQLYKGKQLRVIGTVKSIDKDIFDHAVVTLVTRRNQFMEAARCTFDDADAGTAAALRPSQRVVLVGDCRGKHGLAASLNHCKLSSVAERTADRVAMIDALNTRIGSIGSGAKLLTLDDDGDAVVVAGGSCGDASLRELAAKIDEDIYQIGLRVYRCANGTVNMTNYRP